MPVIFISLTTLMKHLRSNWFFEGQRSHYILMPVILLSLTIFMKHLWRIYFWGQEKPLRFWCQWYNSDNIYETFVKNRFFEGKRSHRYFEGKRSHLIFWSQECYINILIFRGLKGNTDYSSNSWLYIFLSPRATHWDSKCHIQTKKAFVIGICIIILLGTNYIIKIEAKIVFPQLRVSLIKIQTYLHTYIIYNHNYIICK